MHAATLDTYPVSIRERELAVLRAATVAKLATWEVAVYLPYLLAFFVRDVLKDLHERVVAEVADLSAPGEAFLALHPVEVKVFDGYHIVFPKQPASQLEMPVPPLVRDTAVRLRQLAFGFSAVVRATLLAREVAMKTLHLFKAFFEVLRRLNLFSIGSYEEAFQAEVQPDSITCSWQFRGWRFLLDREADPQVAYGVPFDRDSLNVALNGTRFDKLVVVFADTHTVSAKQLPAGLRERKRCVPGALLKARPTSRRNLEEALVRLIEPLDHVLSGLRIKAVPTAFVTLLTLRQMTLELVVAGVLAEDLVVPARQRHEVIPDLRGKLDLAYEVPLALRAIQTVFERFTQASGLIFDVLLYDFFAHLARRGHEIGARPKRRKTKQAFVLLAQQMRASTLESVDDLVRRVPGVGLDEEVYVIRLNRQGNDLPIVFVGHLFEDLTEPVGNGPFQDTLPTLRTPHEMILHRVDGVARSAVLFFVDCHHSINKEHHQRFPPSTRFSSYANTENHERRSPAQEFLLIPRLKPEGLPLLRASSIL